MNSAIIALLPYAAFFALIFTLNKVWQDFRKPPEERPKTQGSFIVNLLAAVVLGIEPAICFDGTNEAVCDCVNCAQCRAARALHSGNSNWLDLASIDADLLSVVLAWGKLSEPVRKGICALVHSAVPTKSDE